MYKYLFGVVLFLLPVVANAQSGGNSYSIMDCCSNNNIIVGSSGSGYSFDNCNSINKTPLESIECKIKYWEEKVKDIKANIAKQQDSLDKANERVNAFRREKK